MKNKKGTVEHWLKKLYRDKRDLYERVMHGEMSANKKQFKSRAEGYRYQAEMLRPYSCLSNSIL